METIEQVDKWQSQFAKWQNGRSGSSDQLDDDYPFVKNERAPFVPARSALSMLKLALISSAGAYIDGTQPFDISNSDGDTSFREIPIQVQAEDILFTSRGYDPSFVQEDINSQIPIARLLEFSENRVIGELNSAWWSLCGFIPNALRVVDDLLPNLIERLERYDVQAALLIPASRLCHQTLALIARGVEQAGIPTMMLAVDKKVVEMVRPPRAGFYAGEFGCVAGQPLWPEHQRRVLDEALRWLEPIDQPTIRKLGVVLESKVEMERGER